jgi:hypothetical protein
MKFNFEKMMEVKARLEKTSTVAPKMMKQRRRVIVMKILMIKATMLRLWLEVMTTTTKKKMETTVAVVVVVVLIVAAAAAAAAVTFPGFGDKLVHSTRRGIISPTGGMGNSALALYQNGKEFQVDN